MEALIWDILPEMVPLILGCVARPYKSRTLNHRGRAELTACPYQGYVSASGPQARGDKQPENKNRHLLFLAHVQMPDVLTGIRRVSSCILSHLDISTDLYQYFLNITMPVRKIEWKMYKWIKYKNTKNSKVESFQENLHKEKLSFIKNLEWQSLKTNKKSAKE